MTWTCKFLPFPLKFQFLFVKFLFQSINYKLLFDFDVEVGLTKAERITYGDSSLTHAMVFTGLNVDKNGNPTKFRVENSWGDEKCGEKGYLVMTAEWFKEFGFEIVVDKKHVPDYVMNVFDMEPIILPAWDSMGSIKSSFNV
jgi:bleomycin hydrolase